MNVCEAAKKAAIDLTPEYKQKICPIQQAIDEVKSEKDAEIERLRQRVEEMENEVGIGRARIAMAVEFLTGAEVYGLKDIQKRLECDGAVGEGE